MTNENQSKRAVPGPADFKSELTEGWQRFVAHCIEHGFDVGERTPDDFIRSFPPEAIMEGLKDEAQLRANILVICTGVRQKIALKKSASSCGEDLRIALDEDEADTETIVTLFDPDDRVRFLDKEKLWSYVTESEFWTASADGDAARHQRAAAHMAFMIDRALKDGLIDHREVVEGITTEVISEYLPRAAMQQIISGALAASHEGRPFSEADLLEMCPPDVLTEHVPLPLLWDHMIAPKIATRHKLLPGPVPRPAPPSDSLPPDSVPPSVPPESVPAPEAATAAPDEAVASPEDWPAEAASSEEAPAADPPPTEASEGEEEDEDLDMDIDDALGA